MKRGAETSAADSIGFAVQGPSADDLTGSKVSLEFQGSEILRFARGTHQFGISGWQTESGYGYVGFFNGRLSVAARERHVVAKLLLARHSRS